ncbi:MAG: hypothetical protein A2Y41_07510 [Spirochaetes bacterium GWB1_36_13]|nr:MAG: hypothetical protein A2Y41_07510 [Spirochaetes bacterium GWB1_36_13]
MEKTMRLYLINPKNSIMNLDLKVNYFNKFRVWKPLGLLILAGLTPKEWEITIIDENTMNVNYETMPQPDLVGITAFTSQASRAYEAAAYFRKNNIPVVMGGIHATMCSEEALKFVDIVVKGEAESVWAQVLEDVKNKSFQTIYEGEHLDLSHVPIARHDLLPKEKYFFGSIQTSRGCPLNCTFCSVTAFNGRQFRRRPIESVIEELKLIKQKYVLIVDDNLIGTRKEHIDYAKDLFRAIIKSKIKKKFMAQVTINLADDDELMSLARKAGCWGVFIGFESPHTEGLIEIKKKFNMGENRNHKEAVARMHKHGLLIAGSFIMGLDVDKPGIGKTIAEAAKYYDIDILNSMILTPLPGTVLWDKMQGENRIMTDDYPNDWKYFTLTFPVAKYTHMTQYEIIQEEEMCSRNFYPLSKIIFKFIKSIFTKKNSIALLLTELSYRSNAMNYAKNTLNSSFLDKQGDKQLR